MIVLFAYLAALVAIGALVLFKGRDLFRPAISVVAFVLVFDFYTGWAGTDSEDLIIGALAGLVAALLSGFVLKFGAFLGGLIAGFGIGAQLVGYLPQEASDHPLIATAIIALLVAVLTVKCLDVLVTISTAAIGASLMGIPCIYMLYNLGTLIRNIDTNPFVTIRSVNQDIFGSFAGQQTPLLSMVTLILFLIGMVVQFKTNHKIHY